MGLMAPLYIAGLLAVGLPILFHLIRRAPQGRQIFSSLMFLSPSPPRLSKRSRLTNIVLLILRATALIMLALAFARPFFNQTADLKVANPTGRRIALLVDTSASMRRGDLWQQARAKVDEVLSSVSSTDEVGLFLFDRQVRTALSFEDWNQTDPPSRASVLRGRLAAQSPTWSATRMGESLATVADMLSEKQGANTATDDRLRQVVLISDLEQGGHVEALQGHEWPTNVYLEATPLKLAKVSNASLQSVKQAMGDEEKPDGKMRVRVRNEPDSSIEQFSLAWANDNGAMGIEPIKVYVAPGRSQIVRVPIPPPTASAAGPDRLVLTGDDNDFDNTLYIVPPRVDSVKLLYVGDDVADDVNAMRYYLVNALANTPLRKVEITVRRGNEAITDADLVDTRLVVVGGAISEEGVGRLRRFMEGGAGQGGDVLWVLKDIADAQAAARLMGIETLDAREAVGDYSLISRVNTNHPLFVPFADARFADFTKIHFWKHRRVRLPDGSGTNILAWFDNGDPFLFELQMGMGGRMRVMTSSWQPGDSQLALSSKFVLLMEGMLRRKDEVAVESQYAVDEAIALPPNNGSQPEVRTIVTPDGRRVDLRADAKVFNGADRPGIYRLIINGQELPLAANIAPDESRTTPMPPDEFEQWGVRMGNPQATIEKQAIEERKLKTAELENRQKVWWWLVLGVLGLLAVETALAGRLAHRALKEQMT